jgi:predicted transcriptional regulator
MIFSKNREKEKIDLILLKKSLEREKIRYHELENLKNRVKMLEEKTDAIKKDIGVIKDFIFHAYYVREESTRKLKMKMEIKNALERYGKMTASELSKIVNLSRTRCTEYLKEMERKGVVKGFTFKRKKYYEIIK